MYIRIYRIGHDGTHQADLQDETWYTQQQLRKKYVVHSGPIHRLHTREKSQRKFQSEINCQLCRPTPKQIFGGCFTLDSTWPKPRRRNIETGDQSESLVKHWVSLQSRTCNLPWHPEARYKVHKRSPTSGTCNTVVREASTSKRLAWLAPSCHPTSN
jgi:hypothetical protein